VRRYAGPLILLAAAAVVGVVLLTTGGNDAPERVYVAHVRMAEPPLADVLGKAAEQAQLTNGDLGALLERVARTDRLDERLPTLTRRDVTLRDVVLHKDGARASAEATLDLKEVAEYLPQGLDLHYDPKAGGDGIVFRGSTTLLGVRVPITARALAEDGAVVVSPEGLPIGKTTLFSDPRVRVERLSAKPVRGGLRVRVDGSFVGGG
jgi:hypothetical protein